MTTLLILSEQAPSRYWQELQKEKDEAKDAGAGEGNKEPTTEEAEESNTPKQKKRKFKEKRDQNQDKKCISGVSERVFTRGPLQNKSHCQFLCILSNYTGMIHFFDNRDLSIYFIFVDLV